MPGWQNVALDADRAHLLDLLAGHDGQQACPKLKEVFPDLKRFTIAFDFTKKGKTRFRTSVWPGENGTSLKVLRGNTECLEGLFEGVLRFTGGEAGRGRWVSEADAEGVTDGNVEEVGDIEEVGDNGLRLDLANVKRKRFLRGDVRYGFRKFCALLRIRPSGILMRL